MSSHPSPLAVREVKNILKTGAMEMGVVGASTVVDALISSLWGRLFSKSGSRDNYNFLGEVAHRTLSPRHVKVVESAIKNNFPYEGYMLYDGTTEQWVTFFTKFFFQYSVNLSTFSIFKRFVLLDSVYETRDFFF